MKTWIRKSLALLLCLILAVQPVLAWDFSAEVPSWDEAFSYDDTLYEGDFASLGEILEAGEIMALGDDFQAGFDAFVSENLPRRDITEEFKDAALRDALRNILGLGSDDPLYEDYFGEDFTTLLVSGKGISDLSGISCLKHLRTLDVSNNALTSIDLSGLPMLEELDISGNPLPSFTLSGSESLRKLIIEDMPGLRKLAICNNPLLEEVQVYGVDSISNFVVSENPRLSSLQTENLTWQQEKPEENIFILSHNDSLTSCVLSKEKDLWGVTVTDNRSLQKLDITNSGLHSLIVRNNPGLEKLYLAYNMLSSLDVSDCLNLQILHVQQNELSELYLPHKGYQYLDYSFNRLRYNEKFQGIAPDFEENPQYITVKYMAPDAEDESGTVLAYVTRQTNGSDSRYIPTAHSVFSISELIDDFNWKYYKDGWARRPMLTREKDIEFYSGAELSVDDYVLYPVLIPNKVKVIYYDPIASKQLAVDTKTYGKTLKARSATEAYGKDVSGLGNFLGWSIQGNDLVTFLENQELEDSFFSPWDEQITLTPVFGGALVTYVLDNEVYHVKIDDKTDVFAFTDEDNLYLSQGGNTVSTNNGYRITKWTDQDGHSYEPGTTIGDAFGNLTLYASYAYDLVYWGLKGNEPLVIDSYNNDDNQVFIQGYPQDAPYRDSFLCWYSLEEPYEKYYPGKAYTQKRSKVFFPYFYNIKEITYMVGEETIALDHVMPGDTICLREIPPIDGNPALGWMESGGIMYQPGEEVTVREDMFLTAVYQYRYPLKWPDETTTEPPIESTTEPLIESTTQPLTETTTEPNTLPPIESTTFPPAEETTQPREEATTEETTQSQVEPGAETTIPLSRVGKPKAKNVKTGIYLSWEPVENAKKYVIYRKEEGEKKRKIATTKNLFFTDDDVLHTVEYTYYVRAKSYKKGKVTYLNGEFSKGRKYYFVKRSGKVRLKKNMLSWAASKYVDGYELLICDNKEMKGGTKLDVGNVTKVSPSSLLLPTVPAGKYYISLRQYILRDGKKYRSAYHGAKKYVAQ